MVFVSEMMNLSLFLTTQGIWIPEGDTVKLPVAIKTIHDRTKRQTFHQMTDVRKHDLKENTFYA